MQLRDDVILDIDDVTVPSFWTSACKRRRLSSTSATENDATDCHVVYIWWSKTCFQSNLVKGRIADVSPLAAANVFVRSWPLSNTWFNWTHMSQPPLPQQHLDRFTRFCTARPCAQHTDTQITLRHYVSCLHGHLLSVLSYCHKALSKRNLGICCHLLRIQIDVMVKLFKSLGRPCGIANCTVVWSPHYKKR